MAKTIHPHSAMPRPRRRSRKTGLPPGALVPLSESHREPVKITVFDFDADSLEERTLTSIHECGLYRSADRVSWLNIDGVHDPAVVEQVGKLFGIHPLVLEDILNPSKRPKFEDYGDFLFLIMRMVYPDKVKNRVTSEQISLVTGPGFVLSFQEQGEDVLDSVRDRLRKGRARLRSSSADYLAYALMDAIVDSYFSVLEDMGDEISDVERIVLNDPNEKIVRRIHRIKRSALTLRRAAWPQRELIHAMERCENPLLTNTTRIYLRDVYDHAVEIIDVIENFREMTAAQMEMYLSSVSNRMNSVMVVLAIVSTIFMPLTFIVGVYGMNFDYMPELRMRLGYPTIMLVMFLIAAGMIGFFRRREWI